MSSNGSTDNQASGFGPDELIAATRHPLIARAQAVRPDYVSMKTDRQKALLQAQLAVDIAEGKVSLGPKWVHVAPATDIRDMRDPEALGTALDLMRKNRTDCPVLSVAADLHTRLGIRAPDYVHIPIDYAAERQRELEARAANDDKFAQALLRGESLAEDPVD